MTAATETGPTLREIVLDALHDAFYARRDGIEGCRGCRRNPAGLCGDHQDDAENARLYEEARKRIEQTPGNQEVLAVLGEISDDSSGGN